MTRPYVKGGARCSVCGKRSMARELCPNHYKQWQYRQNPAKYRAWESSRRQRETERVRAADRARYQANPWPKKARAKISKRTRRHAPGFATPEQITARIAYYGWRCWLCRAPWEHLDHIIPVSRGGSNWPANLRPACARCNLSRNNRLVSEFVA